MSTASFDGGKRALAGGRGFAGEAAPAPAGRALAAYLAEAKYESIRMLRSPAFAAPFLGMPILLYLLFGVVIAGGAGQKDPDVARFLFTAFAIFGVVGPGLFGFGASLAVEREQGLLKLKRALPMPPAAYLIAKLAMSMLFAAIIMASVLAAALTLGHLRLTIGQVAAVSAIGILGAVPFGAMGLAIGVLVSGRSAPAWVNLVYLPMLHLSGLFYPLPGLLRAMEPIWPVYHLKQLALAAMGANVRGSAASHLAVLAGVTLVCGLFAIRRLAVPRPEKDLTLPPARAALVEAAGPAPRLALVEGTAASVPAPAAAPRVRDDLAIGYLRAFVTVLVLLHHAVLAYHPDAPPAPASLLAQPRWWQAFPVVDPARWDGFRLIVGFNDTFFMSLLFFVSGLFVWSGLARRGSAAFLRGRALRLGVPFVVAAAIVAPLAYYPAYSTTHAVSAGVAGAGGGIGLLGFARQWLSLGNWPAGPAWFLWVLLAFDALAALVFAGFPSCGPALGRVAAGAKRRPALFFVLLLAASAAAYLPLALTVGPMAWFSWGPFTAQTSRILHYAVYFLAGIAVGAAGFESGLERGLLAPDGRLARRWPLWLAGALVAFAAAIVVTLLALAPHASPRAWGPAWALSFVVSCGFSSFAFLALFVRWARRRFRPLDSLRANAYGMYLIHYAFSSWIQLALLGVALSGFAKGTLATLLTVALSWAAVAALRRIPAVARVI